MTRLLATVTDHARRAITALLEHVDAAWDCWGRLRTHRTAL